MTQPEAEQETEIAVLPDATRDDMLAAARMTTSHRWEETFIARVAPDPGEQQDEGFTRSRTS